MYFALNSLKSKTVGRCWVQNIHRSFVGWTGMELSFPTTFVPGSHSGRPAAGKPPEAGHRSTWRRAGARSRLPSFWFRKAPRWTPRTSMARGLNPGSRRQKKSSLPDLGHFKKCWDQMISSSMSMNDHNMQYAKMCGKGMMWFLSRQLEPPQRFSGLQIREKNVCMFSKCLAKLWVSAQKCGELGNSVLGSVIIMQYGKLFWMSSYFAERSVEGHVVFKGLETCSVGLWKFSALNSFEDVGSKTFIVPLSVERV